MNDYPEYTVNERIADSVIHVSGLIFAVAAFSVMLTISSLNLPISSTLTLSIYGLAMMAMFMCSAAYHMIPVGRWKGWLRRVDHAAIFFKIAGTYTPFAVLKLGGFLGYGLLGIVWFFALIGMGLVLSMQKRAGNFIVLLYLALSWVGIVLIWPLMMSLSMLAFALLCVGGVLYTLGTVFHVWASLPFSNAIWHFFVLIATVSHFFSIFVAVIVDGQLTVEYP